MRVTYHMEVWKTVSSNISYFLYVCRFTSAVRVGFVYSGTEVFTFAGGEAMWLFIDKAKMFEFISNGTDDVCYVVELSAG